MLNLINMAKLKFIILVFNTFYYLLFFNSSVFSQMINSTFERIEKKDGLSQSTVNYIIQDKKGFMWFATYGGINKYDGYTFKTYSHDDNDSSSISDNGATYLFEDKDGFIWVTNNANEGLCKLDPETDKFIRYKHNPDDSTSISSNVVYFVMQDKSGNIWISTDNALNLVIENKIENKTFTSFKRFDISSVKGRFSRIYEDKNGKLLLFADYLYYFDRESNTIHKTNVLLNQTNAVYDVVSISEDKKGSIWLGTTEYGIIKLDYNKQNQSYERSAFNNRNIPKNNGNYVLIDGKENVWIGTRVKGLFQYNEKEDRLINFLNDKCDLNTISDNAISSLYIDRSGILWIGTYSQGLCKYNLFKKQFDHFKSIPGDNNTLSGNVISSIHSVTPSELWVGIELDGGINRIIFHKNKGPVVKHYKFNSDNSNTAVSNKILCLVQRKNKEVWVGSGDSHVSKIIPEKPGTDELPVIKRYPLNNWTFSIFEDSQGTLWGGTWRGGLWRFDDKTNTFKFFLNDPNNPSSLCDNIIWAISEDNSGNIWIGGHGGGISIIPARIKNNKTLEFINYKHEEGNNKSLRNNSINAFCQDKTGTMWIGTTSGLNRVIRKDNDFSNIDENNKLEFYSYNIKDGLLNKGIVGIVEDNNNNLWLSTSNGLSMFDLSDSTFVNYSESDGLQSNEFWHNAYFKNSEGRLFFGGQNGFNAFYPDKIVANPFIPQIAFTELKVLNKTVSVGQKINNDIILPKVINELNEIALSHKNNVFIIEFAALHYTQPLNNKYAYYLKGFEDDWNYVENQRSATYTNLDPGKYVFRVKASNNDGIWNEEGISLKITILPAWWQTWWFRLLILTLITGTIIGSVYYRMASIRNLNIKLKKLVVERTEEIEHKNKALFEQTEALNETNTLLEERQQRIEEQTEELISTNDQLIDSNSKLGELNSMKDKIISIIGHDLKNPINAIMGFSEILKFKRDQLDLEKRHKFVDYIYESAIKTYQLLESLLNWARSQSEQIKFEPKVVNINHLIMESTLLLREQASKKDIIISFESYNDKDIVYCDSRMVETVLRNLISNAIKFTKPEGLVSVSYSTSQNPGYITIHVADTGIGISAEQISRLFNVEKSISTVGTDGETGTGLGLVLCKEFIEKNKGEIWVESIIGTGTTFSFTLPLHNAKN